MAIVVVAVSSVMLLSIVKLAVGSRRATRSEAWRVQAAWLAESALQRAAGRLAIDDTYTGETWTIPAEELTGTDGGLVVIEVAAVPNDPSRREVRVRADYPNHPQHRARQSRQTIVQLPTARTAAAETLPVAVSGRTEHANITEEER